MSRIFIVPDADDDADDDDDDDDVLKWLTPDEDQYVQSYGP